MVTRNLSIGLLLVLFLTACVPAAAAVVAPANSTALAQLPSQATLPPTATDLPTEASPATTARPAPITPPASPTANLPTPTSTLVPVLNPLTGLQVEDASLLKLPPALVSISNFPVSARPQSGMATSPLVFEIYIGEGMTRFLALFYGKYTQGATVSNANDDIGPIRSGRIPYDHIRNLYNGFIVMSGAYSAVAAQLTAANTVYNQSDTDINGDKIGLSALQTMAEGMKTRRLGESNLNALTFSPTAPSGGQDASKIDLWWNYLNQVEWTYDAATGAYLRAQDKADGSGKFYPATDKLTGQQLAFNNVVVLFATHDFVAPTLVNIDLLYQTRFPAYLFRDGKAYKAKWSTLAPFTPFQFTDENGKVIPYKPGNTFFEIVSTVTGTTHPGDGTWKFYFPIPK
jgi:hypothetical protein